MPTVRPADLATSPSYTKSPGTEPIPGYVLLEPLGRGGFGEVWKCEAPGGLLKAVKFIAGESDSVLTDGAPLRQEYDAFQQVKAIRHPFLLSLERVELVGDELVMVMELADRQLGDRFDECRGRGLPGVPRDELLRYLADAAEALDVISAQHGLQHLDVKPANLFLTGNRVQVGDYGLVSKLDGGAGGGASRGLTPRYVAPEVLHGKVHTRSDQYSLALVYFEMLTGEFPYGGRVPQQLLIQHASATPDLTALPACDRPAVGRALAKNPDDRFPSCQEFVQGLIDTPRGPAGPPPAARPLSAAGGAPARGPGDPAGLTHAIAQAHTQPAGPLSGLPPLVAARRPTTAGAFTLPPAPPPPVVHPSPEAGKGAPSAVVRLDRIRSVLPVARLLGRAAPDPGRPPAELIQAVLQGPGLASPGGPKLGKIVRLPDRTWSCRFLTTLDPRIAQVKLDLLWEQGGVTMDTRTAGRVVFRKPATAPVVGLFGRSNQPEPKSGLEVVVRLPEPGVGTGEVVATGGLFGDPPPEFTRSAEPTIVYLLDGVRRELNDVDDRRKHPRIPAAFPVAIFPLHSDGRVDSPVPGRCKDLSGGGVALLSSAKPSTRNIYVAFDGVPGAAGLAILVRVVRIGQQNDEILVTGQYRLNLGTGDGDRHVDGDRGAKTPAR